MSALKAVFAKVKAKSPVPLAVGRKHLPQWFADLGFTTGAEVGVWRGGFSSLLCQANPKLHLFCVDAWTVSDDWLDTKSMIPREAADALMAQAYQQARDTLSPLNCTIFRMRSADAAAQIPDKSLDFVYIDANHGYDAVTEDLTLWSRKVRSGGIVSGHDYRVSDTKPFIQVVPAVNDFTQAHGITPWFVLTAERTPSFLWRTP